MTTAQHAKRLLDLMPVGFLMKDKYDTDTNQYKFWYAIAMYYVVLEEDFAVVMRELGIETTDSLIARWEKEFGIPDAYFAVADTLAERRANVILKKSGLNLLTFEDFTDVIDRFGFTLDIKLPSEIRFPPYDVPFFPLSEPGAYFLVIVEGDVYDSLTSQFLDFLESLLPINVGLLLIDTSE